ncbi:hypothetical protein [Acidimangrovimonas pyrenivorans]|uniref:O-antigen ligase domain-containing protein n=1 Tax=Acidimangrovimonas pyrenivorans TaxID=2030798 RepID=A0ABV7AH73_9RHOB
MTTSPRRFLLALAWLLVPVVSAALVVFDPRISALVPTGVWRRLGMAELPYRAIALLVLLSLLGLILAGLMRKARDFETLAVILIMAASQLNGIHVGPLDTFDATIFGLFMAWLAKRGADPEHAVRLSPLFYFASALAFLGFAHLPVMSPYNWFVGMYGIVRVVIVTLLVVDTCRDSSILVLALRAFVLVAVLSALFGVVQFTLAYFGIFRFTLIQPALSAFKPTPFGFIMRASGLCITAQHYSSFLIYALPFALWQCTRERPLRNAVAVAIILAGIGVSLNFGGLFAALFALVLFPFLRWPRLSLHIALAYLALLAIAYYAGLIHLIYEMSFGDAGVAKGVDQRKTLFILGLEEIGRSPFVGTGLHGFGHVDGNFWNRPVHNLLGEAAAELGIEGALILIAIYFQLSLDLVRVTGARWQAGTNLAAVTLLMLVTSLVLGQSEPNLDQSNQWLVFALAQATVLLLRGLPRGGGQTMIEASSMSNMPAPATASQKTSASSVLPMFRSRR